jgi:hypothetical protein
MIDAICKSCTTKVDLRSPCSSCTGIFCDFCFERHSCVRGARADDLHLPRAYLTKERRLNDEIE